MQTSFEPPLEEAWQVLKKTFILKSENIKIVRWTLNTNWKIENIIGPLKLSNLIFPRFLVPGYLISKASFQSNQVAIPVF